MHRLCWFRRAAVFVALLAVAVSPAVAMPWVGTSPAGPLDRLGSWLTAVWAEAGCILDPSGCPGGAGEAQEPGQDAGCIIDPDGRCRAVAERLDEGCIIDPNGGTCAVRHW